MFVGFIALSPCFVLQFLVVIIPRGKRDIFALLLLCYDCYAYFRCLTLSHGTVG